MVIRMGLCALGAAALVGCPPPSPEPPPPLCPTALLIGDGETPFRAREEREQATIVHGPQGGFHVETSLWASGLSTPWEVSITALFQGMIISDQTLFIEPMPALDPCAAVLARALAIFDVHEITSDTPAELLAGQTITIAATVTGEEGDTVSAEIDLIGVAMEE